MIMSDFSGRPDSVLSERPDGVGYYYGHYKGSRIDVQPPANEDALVWRLFIDGDPVGDGYDSKEKAEAAGKQFIERWVGAKDDDEDEE